MTDHELDLRLRAVAGAIDAEAPAFDTSVLPAASPRRFRMRIVALAAALAIVGAAAAPAAVSGLRDLFGISEVKELGPVPPDVVGPLPLFEARQVTLDALDKMPFAVHTLPSLGRPQAAYVRDDISGGMVTLAYGNGLLLTQWPDGRLDARITIVPKSGKAEEVQVGRLPGLWIEGTARGTFTLIGADGAVHKERFDVEKGALLWKRGGVALLLQGASGRSEATKLAAGSALAQPKVSSTPAHYPSEEDGRPALGTR
jgi:hypothetical protein